MQFCVLGRKGGPGMSVKSPSGHCTRTLPLRLDHRIVEIKWVNRLKSSIDQSSLEK